MNFLVVLKDTLIERSTFLYVQLQENKTLLHFSPEFHLEGLTLGEIYQAEGLSAVLHFFEAELELPVKDYIELSLESWDDENSFSIFRRQQKILKSFLKVISKKRNLIKTTQLLKKHPNLLHTSIQFPQLITMIHRFIRMQQLPSKKLFLPLTDTFRVVNREDKKKVIVIDFTRNRNVLHQVAMEKAN